MVRIFGALRKAREDLKNADFPIKREKVDLVSGATTSGTVVAACSKVAHSVGKDLFSIPKFPDFEVGPPKDLYGGSKLTNSAEMAKLAQLGVGLPTLREIDHGGSQSR